MGKLFILALICSSTLALAQETHKLTGSPFSLPVAVDANGKLSIFGENKTTQFSMNPTLLVGAVKGSLLYSYPEVTTDFRFTPINQDNGFISVRKLRIEAGFGISTIIKSVAAVGLAPYKGALQTITQFKQNKKDKNHSFQVPKRLSDLAEWRVGDRGTYETYGGITAYFSASYGIVDFLKASIGIQNEFEIEVSKIDENKVLARFTEGNLKRRQLKVGPFISTFSKTRYMHEALRAEFTFDLDNPAHEALFRMAIKGDFKAVADELDSSLQKLTWEGRETEFFFGLPMVAGRTNAKASFEMDEGDFSYDIDYKLAQNNGILTPTRVHQKLVFQTEESIALIWSSQMQQTHEIALNKNFLSIGKTLGVESFNMGFSKNFSFGTLYTQLALDFSKEDYLGIQKIDKVLLKEALKIKCERENLPCRKEVRVKKIIKKFSKLIAGSWADNKDKVGLLLMEEPALISTILSHLKLEKELYFKFLSEKFQSVEGKASIPL